MTQTDTCHTCGRVHGGNFNPRHPFNDGSLPTSATFGKHVPGQPAGAAQAPATPSVEVVEAAWPFDPVLRQALMSKGVITPEDLRNAEDQIRMVTRQFNSGGEINDSASSGS